MPPTQSAYQSHWIQLFSFATSLAAAAAAVAATDVSNGDNEALFPFHTTSSNIVVEVVCGAGCRHLSSLPHCSSTLPLPHRQLIPPHHFVSSPLQLIPFLHTPPHHIGLIRLRSSRRSSLRSLCQTMQHCPSFCAHTHRSTSLCLTPTQLKSSTEVHGGWSCSLVQVEHRTIIEEVNPSLAPTAAIMDPRTNGERHFRLTSTHRLHMAEQCTLT
ncbi:hypothetical protein TcWFU_006917 [Taenia crassiceps]|uniref:Secreted protein n=1 Tax=Taenia crassiceps TaxID=6207 RepID=A0ABR4Q840_9CEST